jgi:two-component system CheB/CheR fusion protein
MALIEVVDSGIGIAPDFLPHVFERFRQADQSYARQHQHGLGLGLAIVKATVEAHGGSVSVASDGVGRGAKFSIYLPIRESRTHPMMGDERAQDLAS